MKLEHVLEMKSELDRYKAELNLITYSTVRDWNRKRTVEQAVACYDENVKHCWNKLTEGN